MLKPDIDPVGLEVYASEHRLMVGDARELSSIPDASVHLVVTSPPYFDLKQYCSRSGRQLGDVHDYEEFLIELDKVWRECFGQNNFIIMSSRLGWKAMRNFRRRRKAIKRGVIRNGHIFTTTM